jgi:hypothetical protein
MDQWTYGLRTFVITAPGPGRDSVPEVLFFFVDERQPAVRVGQLAVEDVEERPTDGVGHRALAAADGDLVDRADRRHLHGCAAEEGLVGQVEHLAGDHFLAHVVAQAARNGEDRVARDAAKDR